MTSKLLLPSNTSLSQFNLIKSKANGVNRYANEQYEDEEKTLNVQFVADFACCQYFDDWSFILESIKLI